MKKKVRGASKCFLVVQLGHNLHTRFAIMYLNQ